MDRPVIVFSYVRRRCRPARRVALRVRVTARCTAVRASRQLPACAALPVLVHERVH